MRHPIITFKILFTSGACALVDTLETTVRSVCNVLISEIGCILENYTDQLTGHDVTLAFKITDKGLIP